MPKPDLQIMQDGVNLEQLEMLQKRAKLAIKGKNNEVIVLLNLAIRDVSNCRNLCDPSNAVENARWQGRFEFATQFKDSLEKAEEIEKELSLRIEKIIKEKS